MSQYYEVLEGQGAAKPSSVLWNRIFKQKPANVIQAEESAEKLPRILGLWDLLAIGIGGTVGSGIFVLAGHIAANYAGPAVVLSWVLAGIGCIFSGLSYAEMSSRVPSAGSSYAYTYFAIGELPAIIAGWCVALEYGISGAAVARSWGDKVYDWVSDTLGFGPQTWMKPYGDISVMAGFLQLTCVVVMLGGLKLGKVTVNFFTSIKVVLCAFMVCVGLTAFRADNLSPFIPPREGHNFGFNGIIRGATSAFFGYIGYDEVCCMAGEAKDVHKVMPRAVMGTVLGVTGLYVLASLALVGMVPYTTINVESGFVYAFRDVGYPWAQHITAVGEIVTLPIVVFISFLAQPRLQFAMAEDGMLPKIFSAVDQNGTLFHGTLWMGLAMTVVAIFVPFEPLNDMISAGVLIAFNFTNASLIMVNHKTANPVGCARYLALYFVSSCLSVFLWHYEAPLAVCILFSLPPIISMFALWYKCPRGDPVGTVATFRAPFVPLFPALGIALNWYLVAQLTWQGILEIVAYIAVALAVYVFYGYRNSVGNNTQWRGILEKFPPSVSEIGTPDAMN